jgi:hypothetical protein
MHRCSRCGTEFSTAWRNRVWNSPKFLFGSPTGPLAQYRQFTMVRCPGCGLEEKDASVRFLGILPPRAILWFIALALVLAILDAVFWN